MELKAFKDLVVVELSTFVAAPSCGRLLAENGARVIKIETFGGDAWRFYGAGMNCPMTDEENPVFDIVNANKEGIIINTRSPEGKELISKMLEKADIFLSNNRPDALKKAGLDYDSLKDKYPQLIHATITGYGDLGPDVDDPGFDVVAYFARSGMLIDLVKPEEYPIYSPAAFGDLTVGMTLYGGIMTALYNRALTGKGDRVTTSLYGNACWFAGVMATTTQENYKNQYPKTRLGGNPVVIPYRCKDKEWVMLSLVDFNRDYAKLMNILGLSHVLTDPKFIDKTSVLANSGELVIMMEEAFLKKTCKEWCDELKKADIAHAQIMHFKDVSKDPQAIVNNFMIEHEFVNGRKSMIAQPPLRYNNIKQTKYDRGPLLGENTRSIMKDLGYSDDAIEAMIAGGAVKAK